MGRDARMGTGWLPALALALALSAVAPGTAAAQDVCPAASAVEAEAGWAAYRSGDMALASRHFETALQRCPEDFYARNGLGYVRLRAGNTQEAERLWNEVVAVDPGDVDAWVGLGLAAWREGDVDAARDRFERVRALDSGHPTAAEYLARISRIGEEPPPADDPADRAWIRGDTATALPLYLERLAADSGDRVATQRVALIRGWQGEYAEGLSLLGRWLERYPDDQEARLTRARLLAWSGDVGDAIEEVRAVLALTPDHPGAAEALALFTEWARDARNPVIRIADPSAISNIEESDRGRRPAGDDTSRAAYEALLARDPGNIDARLGLAASLAATGAYDAALVEYERILSARPTDGRALVGMSRTLAWAGRLAEAEDVARSALRTDSTNVAAWGVLGRVLYWQGRNGAARDVLEEAAELAPTDPEIQDQLRSIEIILAPTARPSVTWEHDSDGTTTLTTSVGVDFHPRSGLTVSAEGWDKRLEQELLTAGSTSRTVRGGSARVALEAGGGWVAFAGAGGSVQGGAGTPDLVGGRVGVTSPRWRALSGGFELASEAVLFSVATATRGVRTTEASWTGRWLPADGWRVDGYVGLGAWTGRDTNGRRAASLSVSRRWSALSVGVAARGFSFEQNLNDGYFDPDFYGIVELTAYWLERRGPWTILIETAPGLQQVGQEGEGGATIRGHARAAYAWGSGREVSLSYRASSAGLTRLTGGSSRYRYDALVLGLRWVP